MPKKRPRVDASATISSTAIIGSTYRKLIEGTSCDNGITVIGANVWIGEYCVVGSGANIGSGTILDHYVHVEPGAIIGRNSLLIYKAQICSEVSIGNNCIIGGFIGERTIVGDNSRIFGSIVHRHLNPFLPWDAENSMEDGAIVCNDVFIGFGAIITRSITIGSKSYVCAGAIISKDVPERHIAYGINQIKHHSGWRGQLNESGFFYE